MSPTLDEKTLPRPLVFDLGAPPSKTSRLRPLAVLGILALLVLASSMPSSFSPSSLLAALPFSPTPLLSEDGTTLAISWSTCVDLDERFSCSSYDVPLDWSGKEEGTVRLAVIKFEAEKGKKRLGSLLINPGGPGGSGVTAVERLGPSLSILSNGQWDIVSWDPRGVGKTEPAFRCFDSALEESLFVGSIPSLAPLPHNITAQALEDYVLQAKQVLSYSKLLNQACEQKNGAGIGRFLGTESVVRDLEVLSRAVWTKKDVEKGVNFWGFSYGTIVGAYLTAIFPERVGRVIIDGVVHPVLWATSSHTEFEDNIFQSTDAGIELFAQTCVEAGFPRCALATTPSQSKEALLESLATLLDKTYLSPLLVSDAALPGVVTTTIITYAMFESMYKPRSWPDLASALNDALNGDGRALLKSAQAPFPKDPSAPASTTFSTSGIWCNDGVRPSLASNATSQELATSFTDAVRHRLAKVSTWFGSQALFPQCDGLTVEEAGFGRFPGPFNASLSNSILVIGNTADPVTSVNNAYAVNEIQPQSRVIHQDSGGHCSIAIGSLCTIKHIRNFLLTGVLPSANVVCSKIDEVVFPDPDALSSFGAGVEEGGEEWKLLRAAKEVGEGMERGFVGLI